MQWHQLDHMQTICTSLQTDKHLVTKFLEVGHSTNSTVESLRAVKSQLTYNTRSITTINAVLWPLYSQPALAGTSSKELDDFVGAKFYCRHVFADGNQRIRIREKSLEFSTTVSSTLSPYPIQTRSINTANFNQQIFRLINLLYMHVLLCRDDSSVLMYTVSVLQMPQEILIYFIAIRFYFTDHILVHADLSDDSSATVVADIYRKHRKKHLVISQLLCPHHTGAISDTAIRPSVCMSYTTMEPSTYTTMEQLP